MSKIVLDDSVIDTLKNIVKDYGKDTLLDVRKTKALLLDLCVDCRREINLMVTAMEYGVINEIEKAGTVDENLISRLSKNLHDTEGTDADFAAWAVTGWCKVLDKNIPAATTGINQSPTSKVTSNPIVNNPPPPTSNLKPIQTARWSLYPKRSVKKLPVVTQVQTPPKSPPQSQQVTTVKSTPLKPFQLSKDLTKITQTLSVFPFVGSRGKGAFTFVGNRAANVFTSVTNRVVSKDLTKIIQNRKKLIKTAIVIVVAVFLLLAITAIVIVANLQKHKGTAQRTASAIHSPPLSIHIISAERTFNLIRG